MQNKSVAGYLSKQYRAILKKCFLISVGAYALFNTGNAQAQFTPSLGDKSSYITEELKSGVTYFSTFSVMENGVIKNYGVLLKDKDYNGSSIMTTYNNLGGVITDYVVGTTNNGFGLAAAISGTSGSGYFDIKYQNTRGEIETLTFLLTDAAGAAAANTDNRLINSANKGEVTESFVGLMSSNNGGAVLNTGTITKITGNFVGNYATTTSTSALVYGGALYNSGTITDVIGNFIGNYTDSATSNGGGAVYNSKIITNITGDFIGNYRLSVNQTSGGAIRNEGANAKIGTITGDFIGNYVYASKALSYGGAIRNINSATIESIVGDFIGNYAESGTRDASGGAIRQTGTKIGNITGDFIGNYAKGSTSSKGGALYNDTIMALTDTSFLNNYVYAKSSSGFGQGAAIWNSGTIDIIAKTTDIVFSGNYLTNDSSTKVYNAIYNEGTINLSSESGHNIQTYDAFSGIGTYNLLSGTLSLLGPNANFASDSKFNISTGATINTIDNEIRETTLGNLKLSGNIFYGLDVNVADLSGDELTGTLVAGSTGEIIINEINVQGTTSQEEIKINISNSFSGIINLANNEAITIGYDAVLYDKDTGILTLNFDYTLNEAVIDATTDRSYNMSEVENVTKTLGVMAGESLAVNGNHNNITASGGADGMTMTTGQTLSLNNIGTISGFASSFIAATGGDVNITNSDASKETTIQSSITGADNITTSGNIVFKNTNLSADNIVIGDEDIVLDSSTISGNISGGSGDILTNGSTTITNSVVDVTIDGGAGSPLTISNSTISGGLNARGEVYFSGTNVIDDYFKAYSIISNTGILNVNSNFVLASSFSGGGTLNFNDPNKTLTLADIGYGSPSITNTTFNMGAGTLKSSGDGVQNYNIGTATLTDTKLDIDLFVNEDGTISSDVFVGATNTSTAILEAITVNPALVSTNIDGKSGFIKIFADGSKVSVSSGLSGDELLILTKTYTLGLTSKLNGLDYTITTALNTLETAISSVASPRQYIMSGNETAGINNMQGNLTIMGNNSTITNGTITMQEDADLTLNNLTMGADIIGGTNTIVNLEGKINYLNGATITGTTIDLNASSTLKFANDASFNDGSNSLVFNGGNLDIANGDTNIISLNSLKLNADTNWSIDVDLAAGEMDTIEVTGLVGDANLNISYLRLLSDAIIDTTVINFTDNTDLMDNVFYTGQNPIAYSNIYQYDVSYDNTTGDFTFEREEGDGAFNAAVQTESVSNQNIYTANLDLGKNLLAAVDAFSPLSNMASGDEAYKAQGAWVKTYGSNEDVDLGHLTIDNKTYAGILGVDFKPEMTQNGYLAKYSIYAAYLNSTQEYDDVTIEQNGINFGARAMYSRDNIFSGFVANLGFNLIDGNNMFGDEDFETYTASFSNKTGFDINLYDCKYFMQPSLTTSYIYAYTTDYTNSSGTDITSDALHVLNINPQVKFIAELDNGYVPYASVGYNWNLEAGGKIKASDVVLPELSIDPYAEYKVGVSKDFDKGISGFAEVSTTTGGRQGYAAQMGIKWNF